MEAAPRSILTDNPFEFLQASQVMSAEQETLPETTTFAEAIAFFGSVAAP